MLAGYHGKILRVDLSTKSVSTSEFSEEFARKYIGGNGFGIKLLLDECPANVDPFSPDNPFIIATGPCSRTIVPTSSKFSAYSKSPLTGLLGEGIASGSLGNELKGAGYDVLIVKGRSDTLSYLWIDDDVVEFREAEHIQGMDAWTVETVIREELGDPQIEVASIGIAGEKLVKFACICNSRTRQLGRTGLGAVMGSKNLKAIAVRGSGSVNMASPDKLLEVCNDINKRSQGSTTAKYRNLGTPENVLVFNELGCLPTRNFQQATFDKAEKISGELLNEKYVDHIISCNRCPIACDHISRVKEGKYKGAEVGLDFETMFALGPNTGVGKLDAIIKANEICDREGLDTISAGGTIAFAMECFERGIITLDDTNQLNLSFGNHEAMIKLLEMISKREGIGDILAEGSRKAAQIIGKGSERYAVHIKGLELPGYDVRGLKTAALSFGTSTRGACHLRSGSYSPDMKGEVDRYKEEIGRGIIVKEREDLYSILDSLLVCKFLRGTLSKEDLLHLYTLTTGHQITYEELMKAGERIYNLEKLFNLREGAKREDDLLPPRIYLDPIPDGYAKGSVVSREGYDLMLDDYYECRGWTKEGVPTKEKLVELDIGDQGSF
ncbi:MAG: aldehyde ferredoxin oxidoreductase family protein [Candidatus Odinarchaeota archaeon]